MGHVLCNTKNFLRLKFIYLLIQQLWAHHKLCVRIQNNKFVKRKHEVVERGNVKQILKYGYMIITFQLYEPPPSLSYRVCPTYVKSYSPSKERGNLSLLQNFFLMIPIVSGNFRKINVMSTNSNLQVYIS